MLKEKAKGQYQKLQKKHTEELQKLQDRIKELEETKSKADMLEENQELKKEIAGKQSKIKFLSLKLSKQRAEK